MDKKRIKNLLIQKYRKFTGDQEKITFRKIAFWILTGGLTLAVIGFFLLTITIFAISISLPDVTQVRPALSTEIYDRQGKLLYTIHGSENREYVSYEKISKNIVNATVSIEDDNFWNHSGFDFSGIAKGLLHEVFGIGQKRGGSTITQQFAKNMFLSSERSYIRKLKELILAVRIENAFDKEKIIELYLNQIPYGNNGFGVQKAAEIYFGKNAADLSIGESAVLASIPQLPTYYNPYGAHLYSSLNKDFEETEVEDRNIRSEGDLQEKEIAVGLIGHNVKIGDSKEIYLHGRSDITLKRMLDFGYITATEKETAWQEMQKLEFKKYRESIRAPHFVLDYVKRELENKYGKELVEQGGLKVYTTIDGELQDYAEDLIYEKGSAYEKAYKANNISMVSLDPKTGEILAMVGSRDYWNDGIEGKNNIATSLKNPGSSFKPIVYAQAFLNGYGPATVLYDTPLKLGPDTPQNYDGSFHGPMSIRRALGQSRNIPAIKAYYLGGEQKNIIELAQKLGIDTLNQSTDYGYPLAIGSGETRPIDMATAFAVFANNGKKPNITGITKIEDNNGNILEEYKPEDAITASTEAIDPQVAYLVNNILSDQSNNLGSNLNIPGHIAAAKTGTSTKETKSKGTAYPKDLWTVGYTPQISTAVWVGNTRGEGLSFNADGYTAAAPIWKAVMTQYLKNKPNEEFIVPEGIVHVSVGTATGLLPGAGTPSDKIRDEVFSSFGKPTMTENVYMQVEIDKTNGLLANEFCPQEVVEKRTFQKHQDPIDNPYWQEGVRQWLAGTKNEDGTSVMIPPSETSPNCKKEYAENLPTIEITSPSAYSSIQEGNTAVTVSAKVPNGVKTYEYYFDNALSFVSDSPEGKVRVSKLNKPGTKHLIKVKVIDNFGYSQEAVIEVTMAETTEN